MFISWGTQSFRRKAGYAADFCGVCRSAAVVEVQEIRSRGHVYGIGMGQGKVIAHVCQCLTCGCEWGLRTGTIQRTVTAPSIPTLEALLTETFPRFAIVYGERLEQEAALRSDPFSLDEQVRVQLIAEPFFILDNDITKNDDKTTLRAVVQGLGCLVTIGILIASVVAFIAGSPLYGILGLVITGVLTWLTFTAMNKETARYMCGNIYPKLSSCLAPLRPTEEELTTILGHLDSKCARATNLKDLLPLIEDAYTKRPAPQAQTNVGL